MMEPQAMELQATEPQTTEPQVETRRTYAYLKSVVDTVREPFVVLDQELRVVSANRAFYQTFGVTTAETEKKRVYELGDGQWDIPALRQLLEQVLPQNLSIQDFEVEHVFPQIGRRVFVLNASKLYRPGNFTKMVLLAMEDVTEPRAAQRALQAAYDRERRITEALQRPLTLEVAEDAFPGLQVATLYEAALEEANVGGDFFDAFSLPSGRVALVVADASGKGLGAAARAAQIKDVVRAFAREYPHSPAHILARLNDYVCDTRHFDDQSGEAFVVFSLAILDPTTGEGAVASAGSEPPLVLRAGGANDVIDASGLPLGIEPRALYPAPPLRLAPGDTLLMVTDGITEARSGGTFFGYDALAAVARRSASAFSLRQMGRAILDEARAFGGGFLRDDACLLLAKRR